VQNRPAREPGKNVNTGFKPKKKSVNRPVWIFLLFFFTIIFFIEKHQVVWFCNSNQNQKLNREGKEKKQHSQ
jgi:hypothetical protein